MFELRKYTYVNACLSVMLMPSNPNITKTKNL